MCLPGYLMCVCVFVKGLLGKHFGAAARPQTLFFLLCDKVTSKLKVLKVMLHKCLCNRLDQEKKGNTLFLLQIPFSPQYAHFILTYRHAFPYTKTHIL